MKKNGKITVKHYLNRRAKAISYNGDVYYPLYLQIIVSGYKAQLKSKVQEYLSCYRGCIDTFFLNHHLCNMLSKGYLSEDLMEKIEQEKIFPLYNLMNDETDILKFLIEKNKPFGNENFSLTDISSNYDLFLKDIRNILDNSIKQCYLKELNDIFLDSTNREGNRKIFKLSNFFIHYINWNVNFCDYYDMTYEVLPSEIKYIENYLSKELKEQIKTILAFHSRANYLKRYLDKIEKGLFPTINYKDWENKGKEFIREEFEQIFGLQKSVEYLDIIDNILIKELQIMPADQ